MKNIRPVNCCANCRHCDVTYEYDGDNDYYCTVDGKKRPWCGRVAMDEGWCDLPAECDKKSAKAEWDAYRKTHEVNPFQICDFYDPKETT